MKNIQISIIVPVYNVEHYLKSCIDSVLNQTYNNWELLLINDGSSDRSGEICDRYAKLDARIKCFHKNNGGVSSARNFGLNNSNGSWIMFVDADDSIAPNTLSVCADEIINNSLDTLQFSIYRNKGKGEGKDGAQTPVLSPHKYFKSHKYQVCIGGTITKRAIIEKNNIKFNETIKLAEDQLFIIECLANSRRIKKIGAPLYYYTFRKESASNTVDIPSMICSCEVINDFKQKYPEVLSTLNTTMSQFICLSLARATSDQILSIKELYDTAAIPISEPIKLKYWFVNFLLAVNFGLFSRIFMMLYHMIK